MTEPHLDLDALADLLVGEGDEAALAHVSGCTACSAALADVDAALPAVDALLREEAARPLPAPPADLVPALLAGLPEGAGDRSPVSTGTGGAGSTVLPGTVTPLRQPPARRPRVLGAAAAGVALLALVGAAVALSRDGSGGDDTASSAVASAPSAADLPVRATGSDYTDAASVARVLPVLLGTEAAGGAASSGASDSTAAGAPLPDAARSSAAAGSARQAPDPAAAVAAPAAPADPLARLRDPEQLAGCLGELTGPDADVVPLALDYARYRGAPALAVVLPSARADTVDVFVVGAGCKAGDDRTLFFTRQPRP